MLRASALVGLSLAILPTGCHRTEPHSPEHAPGAAVSIATPAATSAEPAASGPPEARRAELIEDVHGVKVADPYRWLEDVGSKETQSWLDAFDRFTRRYLDELPNRESLAARIKELSYVEWVAPPRRRGTRYFWTRQHKDKEKAVWYWREGKNGTPQVLIDPNTLSEDGSVALHGVFPSYDGTWVAYKLSQNNKDEATLFLLDVATGTTSTIDKIDGAKYAEPSWDPQGTGFYYTRLPNDPSIAVDKLPGEAAVYFHRLGDDPANDALIHEKTGDPQKFIGAEVSRDGHYLFLGIYHGWTKNDVYYRDLRKHKEWQPLVVGKDGHFYQFAWKDTIYLRTDLDAPRYRLVAVDPNHVGSEHWQDVVREQDKAVLEDFDVVGGHLALRYLENASSRLVVADLHGKTVRTIDTPSIGTLSDLYGNPEDDEAYYSYESFLDPSNVYETSVKHGGKKPFFEVKVPVDPSPYVAEQVWYPSKDGTPISMFVIHRKDMKKDGSTPFLLTGYGGFKISKVPAFTATLFAWLDRGGGYALPNLRGGGEYGEGWHRAGMLEKKQNVFDDFIGAAEWLEKNGYSNKDKLAITGGSNGGLLVGAAMTQRPELFRAVVCAVPLLDMVRYHLFGSGRTWISEYGSAEDAEQFKSLYAYSPYHHVKLGTAYPALLMLTADSDDRVDPMHARKFAAAVAHARSNAARVLVRVETHAGHSGGDMIKKNVDRSVDLYAFLFHELGMDG